MISPKSKSGNGNHCVDFFSTTSAKDNLRTEEDQTVQNDPQQGRDALPRKPDRLSADRFLKDVETVIFDMLFQQGEIVQSHLAQFHFLVFEVT